jgi:hypothetical protein
MAMDHVRAAADAGSPVLATLLAESHEVAGTAEWNDWRKRDPQAVEWSTCYVLAIQREATADRDWLRALECAEKMVTSEQRRRRLLANDEEDRSSER